VTLGFNSKQAGLLIQTEAEETFHGVGPRIFLVKFASFLHVPYPPLEQLFGTDFRLLFKDNNSHVNFLYFSAISATNGLTTLM
jgi:hypothetical protein